jgi:tripeptidyl-peptidase-1
MSVSRSSLCNIFMQLGARGTSVLVASGDGGVAGIAPDSTCTTFIPTFPASCPYVTVVGATRNVSEVGAELSAGGFSNYYGRPSYQASAVNSYVTSLGSTYQGRYNPNGRAYPDVSAQGQRIVIVKGGKKFLGKGTSASTPIFASVIANLNDRLLQKCGKTLGFLNPLLYRCPEIFNDITSGNNPSCSSNGFSAKSGWDAVTGLGTPNFAKFASFIGV